MTGRKAVMDLGRDDWLPALGMDARDIPRAVIMESSWWREQRTAWRLGLLDEVREFAFPDMFHGLWRGSPIGTCGALDPGLTAGDVVVPSMAVAREGVAHMYGVTDPVVADRCLTGLGRSALEERGIRASDSLHLTWSSIFAQSGAMVEEWRDRGYGSVDMEAATVYAVAYHFGFEATALLVV